MIEAVLLIVLLCGLTGIMLGGTIGKDLVSRGHLEDDGPRAEPEDPAAPLPRTPPEPYAPKDEEPYR